jgi:hypothetical protein
MEGSYSFFKLITGFIKGALTAWKLTINKVIGKAQATGKRKIFHGSLLSGLPCRARLDSSL